MLEIELADGSGRLDLLPDTKIDFEQEFNLYNFDFIEGIKSWSFSLPKTANNIRLIGYNSFIESRSDFENRLRINVNINSNFWKTGLLYFITESKTDWSVYFAGEAGLLKQIFNDSSLIDYELSSVTSISNIYSHAKTVAEEGPSLHAYTFAEVYLPKADINPDEIPLPFANYLTFNSSTQNWSGFASASGDFYWPLIPFPFVKSVLKEIADILGVKFAGKLWANDEFERLVFFNTKCLNGVDKETGRSTLFPVDEIHLKNHIPDMNVTDLLRDIAKFFNQIIIYDDKTSTINFFHRNDLLVAQLNESIRYKVESISQEFSQHREYKFESPYREEDVVASDKVSTTSSDLTGIAGEDQSTLVETLFGTLPMRTYGGLLNEVVPVSTMNFNEDNPMTFLFLSYRKSVRFSAFGTEINDKVPFLRSDINYSPPVGEAKDFYGLQWKGGSGLYSRWWEGYLNSLKKGKVLKVYLVFTIKDLMQFNPLKRYALFNYIGVFEKLKTEVKGDKLKVEAQILKF